MSEISIHGVMNRGIANQESVILRANAPVNVSRFALTAGVMKDGSTYPFPDAFFWFGATDLKAGDLIVVLTGYGNNRIEYSSYNLGNKVYTLYWGRKETLFHRPETVAILIDIAKFSTSLPLPPPVPQIHTPLVSGPNPYNFSPGVLGPAQLPPGFRREQ